MIFLSIITSILSPTKNLIPTKNSELRNKHFNETEYRSAV